MTRRLILNDGERELLLVGNIVVGRDPVCDLGGDDTLLSRRHAEFVVSDSTVTVRDLGSRNGVFVNGMKVAEDVLHTGNLVRIGHLRLTYAEDSAPLASALQAAASDTTALVPAPSAGQPSSTPAPPLPPGDDDERTRLVPAPARVLTTPAAATDDEYTRLVSPPGLPAQPEAGGAAGGSGTRNQTESDEEYTRLVAPPRPAVSPPATPAVQGVAAGREMPPQAAEDEEFTRLVRAPRGGQPAPAPASGPASDSEATRLISAPAVRPIPVEAAGARAAAAAVPTSTPPGPPGPSSFVFIRVALLAVVVSLAVAAPFVAQGARPTELSPAWVLGAVAVVCLATYLVGAGLVARDGGGRKGQE